MYEHYLKPFYFYDFASELYLRKALRPSQDVLRIIVKKLNGLAPHRRLVTVLTSNSAFFIFAVLVV